MRGNLLGATGMLLAVVATLLDQQILGTGGQAFGLLLGGVVLGAAIGATLALRIEMTAMPEMVALLNAFGGGASALVAGAVLVGSTDPGGPDHGGHRRLRAHRLGHLLGQPGGVRQAARAAAARRAGPSSPASRC